MKRFDEVFQLMIIVEAVLVEFTWTFVSADAVSLILFIGTLLLWAIGTLIGGTKEYTIKTLGFYLSFIVLSILFLFCIVPIPPPSFNEFLLVFFMIVIVFPTIGFLLSVGIISYLGTAVDRSKSLLLIIGATVGFEITLFLLNLDKFV